ncbi:MAG: carotenoid 1,2-hydratase [Desulfobacteraceae bacterium]|nr:MAG: carotenoid 1,2-hydratase [Desulfobacteraceae bacterium]
MAIFKIVNRVLLVLIAAAGLAVAGDTGFLSVTEPCRLEFPRDHGPHPGFRTEWWYWTGNLKSETGRRFGFQLTFFRYQLTPFGGTAAWPDPPSAWRSRQIYLGHAALSDMAGKRHFQTERAARQALGLGGWVRWGPDITLFLRNWYAVILPDAHRLHAFGDDFDFTLEMKPVKEPVRHGINGYSRKGGTPERASCYYSFTRLATTGTVTVAGKSFEVEGESWMDHEFSTAPLEPGTVGWDWFSIQLADKSEIMLYLLRQEDGGLNPASSGSYIDATGALRHLERGYFKVEVKDTWKSPTSGAVYPRRWKLSIPLVGAELDIVSNLDDQEMRTAGTTGITYWEGSVAVKGTKGGSRIEGRGYVELTGYAGPLSALQ